MEKPLMVGKTEGRKRRDVLAICSDGFVTKKKIGFFFPGPV